MSLYGYKQKGKPANWTKAFPKQTKRINAKKPKARRYQVSKLSRFTQKRRKEYKSVARSFLATNTICAVCGNPGTINNPLHIHHKRGRTGDLLLNTNYFIAVHDFPCHRWIHDNPNESIKAGYIGGAGEWGVQ